ncbi:cold-shock protein [Faucicola boevrei]|uniref:cold-shock protein n=1 Tax=Faucicola boevrei TaxID=346665 RepID=UPI00036C91D5|nr:cold shock domain-containing protein [Moraxella boevrei]
MSKGVISRWNGDKGFGFIKSDEFEKEVFVHISAFPKGSLHPRIWDRVIFQTKRTPKGISVDRVRYDNIDREPNQSNRNNSIQDYEINLELLQDD